MNVTSTDPNRAARRAKVACAFAALAFLLTLLTMAGCSSGEDEQLPPETEFFQIEVVETGGTIVPADSVAPEENPFSSSMGSYAFVVANNNEGWVAQNVTFNIMGFDENGMLLFSGGSVADNIYPGIPTVITGTADMDSAEAAEGPVATVSVAPIMANVQWVESELTDQELQSLFTVENDTANDEDSMLSVSATVTGDLSAAGKIINDTSISSAADANAASGTNVDSNLLRAHGVLLLRDADGNILMGSESTSVLIDQEFLDKVQEFDEEEAESTTVPPIPVNFIATISSAPAYSNYEICIMPGLV